jgi:hypothetical protein
LSLFTKGGPWSWLFVASTWNPSSIFFLDNCFYAFSMIFGWISMIVPCFIEASFNIHCSFLLYVHWNDFLIPTKVLCVSYMKHVVSFKLCWKSHVKLV